MKKNIVFALIVLIIVAGAFYGGMKYAESTRSLQANVFQQNGQGNSQPAGGRFQQGAGGTGISGRMNGNFINGEIIAKDDTSVTIKLRNGGSQFIFFSPSTQIMKSSAGSSDDLRNGVNIMASGTSNSDGSVTAQTIQIRPEGEAFANQEKTMTQESTSKKL